MTNRDKLNGMSNEELAKILGEREVCECCAAGQYECGYVDCRIKIEEWLESEVEQ